VIHEQARCRCRVLAADNDREAEAAIDPAARATMHAAIRDAMMPMAIWPICARRLIYAARERARKAFAFTMLPMISRRQSPSAASHKEWLNIFFVYAVSSPTIHFFTHTALQTSFAARMRVCFFRFEFAISPLMSTRYLSPQRGYARDILAVFGSRYATCAKEYEQRWCARGRRNMRTPGARSSAEE